ncbi:MAG: hypothetical protein JXQ75_15810 [Phycisphaerae bacterium]|nr:hypothetical protein [Phycisphaerae bacterium]
MEPEHRSEAVAIAVPQPRQTVLWIIAILLAIIATVLVLRATEPLVVQQVYGDAPMVGARGVFAFTGQLGKNQYGLFMMDVDSSNIWCYEYLPGTRKLKLVAARSFRWDRYLEEYANDVPTPDEIRVLVTGQSRIEERINGGVIAPGDADGDEKALETNIPGFPP